MNAAGLFKRLEKFTVDNAPAILTTVGVVGTLSTAFLTGKATFKATVVIRREHDRINPPHRHDYEEVFIEPKDVVKMTWKFYIPAATTAAFTIASIIGANHISTRRAASMAAAYTISERAFSEYKEKVVEKLGAKKEQAVKDEVAQDRVRKNPPEESTVLITDGGEVLCYDSFTGRYFKSSMESLKQAENEINHRLVHDGYACLTELYDVLGLPGTSFSDEVGWNMDKLLHMQYSTVLSPDGRPCISIDFEVHPSRKFSSFAEG